MLTMTEPHMALFIALTGVGKTHLAQDLLEKEYLSHFAFIVILCPMLKHNEMYKSQEWFWTDRHIIPIELSNRLHDWIKKTGKLLAGSKTFFLDS